MAIVLLNRVAEPTTYTEGLDGPEVRFSAQTAPVAGMQKFSVFDWAAAGGGQTPVLVWKDDDNWWLGVADVLDDNGVSVFVLYSEEASAGTLTVDDAVTVTACPTKGALEVWLSENAPDQRGFTDSTVSSNQTLSAALAAGTLVRATNGSGITLTLPASAPSGWWLRVARAGAGTVTIAPPSGGTINGASSSVSISAQWRMVECYALGSNAYLVPNL